jgi:hypothetical protein
VRRCVWLRSFAAVPAGAEQAPIGGIGPPAPYRTRVDTGLSGGIAVAECDLCWDARWGPTFGWYLIVRPWPWLGFGFVYEWSTYVYRMPESDVWGTSHLMTPVIRVKPWQARRLDAWIDGGVGWAAAGTESASGDEASARGVGATIGGGLELRLGPMLRMGAYARATAIGTGREQSCSANVAGRPSSGPAHVGTQSDSPPAWCCREKHKASRPLPACWRSMAYTSDPPAKMLTATYDRA